MKNNKKLAKVALAGLLLISHLHLEARITDHSPTDVLIAVASSSQENVSSNKPEEAIKNSNTYLANAGGDFAVPRSQATIGGGYSRLNSSPSNVGGYYGGNAPGGSYTNSSMQNSNVGGSYGIPQNRYGGSTEAGSWSTTPRRDLGRERVQDYNYNTYNTNRNFETSPNYQGDYVDSSFYSDTVAPYGAPQTRGYDKSYNRETGYGYEGITTSGIVTESQLRSLASREAWNIYMQLDGEGKALALQLASQANFSNKDAAIKEAYLRMQERRSYMQNQ